MTTFSKDQIEAAKPTDRAALKKAIGAAVAKFADRVIPTDNYTDVAVGAAEIEFDDSDQERLCGTITYNHGQQTHGKQATVILDDLTRTLAPERIGLLGFHVELMGCHSDGVRYSCDWRVRCPA